LVRTKSILETVHETHVSSAFLLVTASAGSDAPTVANSIKPQVVVLAARPCLIARVKRTTNGPASGLAFSDDPAGARAGCPALRTDKVNGWCVITEFKSPLCSVEI
jgi:hypothetical protein